MRVPMYKIALLGDGAVGKTALRNRFMGKDFAADYLMTIGADFASKAVKLDGKTVKFQIWDLAGQPRFEAVRELYYRGAVGGLLVYDVTRYSSFENTPRWVTELWQNNGKGKVPIVVLGNKIDLREALPDSVIPGQGNALAHELSKICAESGFEVQYLETSAKTGVNVDRAFSLLGETIITYVESKVRGRR